MIIRTDYLSSMTMPSTKAGWRKETGGCAFPGGRGEAEQERNRADGLALPILVEAVQERHSESVVCRPLDPAVHIKVDDAGIAGTDAASLYTAVLF